MQQLATSHKNFNLFAIGNETFILDYKVTLVMVLYFKTTWHRNNKILV